MNQRRGRMSILSLLFVAIMLQTILWPVVVSSASAFDTLPYHTHLYLHLHAHTQHEVHNQVSAHPTYEVVGAPWAKVLADGALCQVSLVVSQRASILIPENLSALVSALANNLFLLPHAIQERFVTIPFLPLPDQPPRF